MPPSKSFYNQDTITVAKELLGKILIHYSEEGITAGIIVETEAYMTDDPASHAFRGQTFRNKAMFADPGHAYIYFTYGKYFCLNVTTREKGVGEAVLIRAIQPVEGVELMKIRRGFKIEISDVRYQVSGGDRYLQFSDICNLIPENLTNGPAKLVIAMGIEKDLYGHDLTKKPLQILDPHHVITSVAKQSEVNTPLKPFKIVTTTRVGISSAKDLPLRFYIEGNKFVSKNN
jgi:DNA-3-methyladenine glycosylase